MKKSVRLFSLLLILSLLLVPVSASAQTWNQDASVSGVGVLDDFNRADGALGANWSGNQSKYRIVGGQLSVRSSASNSDMYWKTKLEADQEVFVTLKDINENSPEQILLLKSQNNRIWGKGVIEALYNAKNHVVQVWTWEWPQGWVKYGDDIPVTFVDGDVFRARAYGNGIVEVYRNSDLLGSRDITSWSYYDKGGYVGLWFIGAQGTILDDFGGGTIIDPPWQLVDLQLLAFNDYHGYLETNSNPGPGNVGSDPAGGGEYLSAKLSQLRQGHTNTITVAAGDLIGGSPFLSGLFHDEPSVESLNSMGLIVSSVGNHEFDEGVTELLRMQNGGCHPVDGCYFPGTPYAGANFHWLAANVVNDTTGETALPPYWINNIDGVDVAFIGMTLEDTDTLVGQAGITGWSFLDEAETANALVPILHNQGVDAIVVLLHEGGSQTPPPGAINACVGISGPIVQINSLLDPAIDAVITGHTHLPYNCLLSDPNGNPRIVTSAYSFGRVVSELGLVLDRRTNDVRRDLSTAVNHAVIRAQLTPDPAITSIINKWKVLADPIGKRVVGYITGDIKRAFSGSAEDRGAESNAGNMIADAQLWATQANGAQIAFMNPGGIRSDLVYAKSGNEAADGIITYAESFTFQPFSNILMTIPMTGQQIVSVLEQQCQPTSASRPFLHLGVSTGFTYDLSKTINASNKCTAVTVTNVQLNGVPLDLNATYYVTVNNFLADGGDNFTTFNQVSPALRVGGGIDLDELNRYLSSEGPIDPPGTNRVNELP
ncbi:MAG: bifunctional metallophosphatase/5'-nucleotidase [Anaerolineales bacterium]|nr:bifunctional metallophosphatase/5'-nucleotidase [Anaerolineales bacterium]